MFILTASPLCLPRTNIFLSRANQSDQYSRIDNDLHSFQLVLLLDLFKGKFVPHPTHPAPATKLVLLMEDESPCQEGWPLTKGPASHFVMLHAHTLLGPQNPSLTGHASLLHLLTGDTSTIHIRNFTRIFFKLNRSLFRLTELVAPWQMG